MIELSKSEIKILKEYEVHFNRAKNGYLRAFYSSDINKLEPIYNKLGQRLENRNCATCVLGMLTYLANIYYNL